MGRLDAKLVRLSFRRGPVTEEVTLTESYTFSMITDGFVACGIIKPEERADMEYVVERTGEHYDADRQMTLGQSNVKPWDRLTIARKGGEVHERRNSRIRRIG